MLACGKQPCINNIATLLICYLVFYNSKVTANGRQANFKLAVQLKDH